MPAPIDFLALIRDPDYLQLMLLGCPDGIVATDSADNIVLYTGAAEAIFGFDPVEVLRGPLQRLLATERDFATLQSALAEEGQVTDIRLTGVRKDGGPFTAALSAVTLTDRYGDRVGTVLYVRDHSPVLAIENTLRSNNEQLNTLVKRLNYVAQHDQLTGLLNRGSAVEAAENALHAGPSAGQPLGIAVFDVDHFKRVNDTYGHLEGDRVLAGVAGVLRQSTRGGDIVGRFGGEEFVAFLPSADVTAVTGFAERVRRSVSTMRIETPGGGVIAVTLSAGVASLPSCASTLVEGIKVADDRLYMAKRGGRDRVVFADELAHEQPLQGRAA